MGFHPYEQFTSPAAHADNDARDPSRTSSTAAVGTAGVLLKNTPGRLFKLDTLNLSATVYYVMVFDKASAPINTDVPIWRRLMPASSEMQIEFPFGLFGTNGLAIAISTTPDALTLPASNHYHYGAQFK